MTKPFSIFDRIRSFADAIRGIRLVVVSQHNAWIHLVASVLVLAAAVLLEIDLQGWLWIVAAIVSVWVAEAVNTAIEVLADVVSPGMHPEIRKAKDIAAGAVLLTAVGAVVIGVLILGPPLLKLIAQ